MTLDSRTTVVLSSLTLVAKAMRFRPSVNLTFRFSRSLSPFRSSTSAGAAALTVDVNFDRKLFFRRNR